MQKEELKLNISGMSCVNCAKGIESNLTKNDDIISCEVNFASKLANITFDANKINKEKIILDIKQLGYEASLDTKTLKNSEEKQFLVLKRDFFLSLSIAIIVLFSMTKLFTINSYLLLALASIVQFIAGKRFYVSSFHALKNINFDMNVLVALGTSAAYFYSAFVLLFPNLFPEELRFLYFDGAIIIITFILLGRVLEENSRQKASKYLKEFENFLPNEVLIQVGVDTKVVPLNSVNINDTLIIKAGDKIPVDGEVIYGEAELDTSNITGEFMPQLVKKGSKAIAGSINQNGYIKVKALKLPKDSTISKIIQLLQESSNKVLKISRFANKVASIFVPTVIAISILTFIIWTFVFDNLLYGILTSISVLIISCPCALGLATPITIVNALGKGAKEGILIKNPEILEIIHNIKYAVFDKTGTITNGLIRVDDYIAKEEYFSLLNSIQSRSEHPISKAFTNFFKTFNIKEQIKITEFKNLVGLGVSANFGNNEVLIGSKKLLDKNSVEINKEYLKFYEKSINEGSGVIFASIDKICIGVFLLNDSIKAEAFNVIKSLKQANITPILLTGDKKEVANTLASKVGITKVISEVLPNEKYEEIKKLQKEAKVLFVGDGVNDALALKQANIGVALSSGADITKEVGDILILDSRLNKVTKSINLSKQSIKIIKQNLFWAFFYNSLGIPLAAGLLFPFFGILLSPMYAGIAMSFSSLIVVLNSLRIRRMKL